MKSIRSVLSITSLVLFALAATTGCSKTNKVNISEGDLPAGSECTAGPTDPCEGTCFQGVCRSPCGSNRQCPANLACFGEGEAAVCAPVSSMAFDLLKDCGEGCEVDLLPFDREGYFRACERQEQYDLSFSPAEATDSRLDPREACVRTVGNALAVKDGILYGLDFMNERPTCDTELQLPVGVLGSTLVAYDCDKRDGGQPVSTACTGRLMNVGGKTYLLLDPWCTPSYYADSQTSYWLYEFSPEKVKLPCVEADAPTCAKPSFPPVGPAVSGFEGLWVICEDGQGGNLCVEPSAENAEDVLARCAELDYEAFLENGFGTSAIYIRPDGYGIRSEGYPEIDSCNFAFRETGDGRVVLAGRAHAPLGSLDVVTEDWQLVTTESGETLLWRSDESICYKSNAGSFFKEVELPADFQDDCDWGLPEFTF